MLLPKLVQTKLVQPLSFSTPCALEQLRCTGMHRLDQEENQTSKNIAQGLSNLGSISSSTTGDVFVQTSTPKQGLLCSPRDAQTYFDPQVR